MDEEIRHKICRKIIMFNCMMRDHRNKDMECLGITGRQTDVLFYLLEHREEQIKQVMIEREFQLSNPTITGILNRLEQNGFIQRVAAQSDRRCNYIMTTQKTELICEQIRKKGGAMERTLFDGVSMEELQTFLKVFDTLYHNLEEMRLKQEKE